MGRHSHQPSLRCQTAGLRPRFGGSYLKCLYTIQFPDPKLLLRRINCSGKSRRPLKSPGSPATGSPPWLAHMRRNLYSSGLAPGDGIPAPSVGLAALRSPDKNGGTNPPRTKFGRGGDHLHQRRAPNEAEPALTPEAFEQVLEPKRIPHRAASPHRRELPRAASARVPGGAAFAVRQQASGGVARVASIEGTVPAPQEVGEIRRPCRKGGSAHLTLILIRTTGVPRALRSASEDGNITPHAACGGWTDKL